MKNYLRLVIIAENYPGISYEILKLIYRLNLELDSVEVVPGEIRVKIEAVNKATRDILIEKLLVIEGIFEVKETSLLSRELNNRKFATVINSVEDGIIVIDEFLNIKAFNDAVLSTFDVTAEELENGNIDVLSNSCPMIVSKLKEDISYTNVSFNANFKGTEKEFISSSRSFLDDSGFPIGNVVIIRNSDEAIELANLINLEREGAFKEIVGSSLAIKSVKNLISIIAKNDSTILLRGDSGTGKELFARAIQNMSNRRSNGFFTINCAAIPDTLIESELFGYEKGSFTGALEKGKIGLFEEANGGTIFLDEIGELSLQMQAKLLRVLQEGKIRRVGSNIEKLVNVRIIAATNRDLDKMITEKTFREDLYYRLNVIPIFIPPLNERRMDIPDLIAVFISKYNLKLNMNIKGVEPAVLEKLTYHDWKGNVRELENVIERSMNLTSGRIIRTENLMLDPTKVHSAPMLLLEKDSYNLKDIIATCEIAAIDRVIKTEKSYRKAAKVLGISHTTLINKVKKYDLKI